MAAGKPLTDRNRRALADMAHDDGRLYVYVHSPHKVEGPSGPPVGSGVVVGGDRTRVGVRMVKAMQALGTMWDPVDKAEALTAEGRLTARAWLEGRDVLAVSSDLTSLPQETDDAAPGMGMR